MKARLFNRFQPGQTATSGKGLGLYLVKTLVEGFHGTVQVEDRVPGDHRGGSRFVITLPVAGADGRQDKAE
jgi:signal transduction histidine kinase